MAQTGLWASANFWQPPRRSWPWPPTRLEILANRLGIDDEELRALLQGEIQRRLRERGDAWEKLDRTLEKRENGGPRGPLLAQTSEKQLT